MQDSLKINKDLLHAKDEEAQPQISVVIPVYNEEPLLPLATLDLHKNLQELRVGFELILCENGSTDATAEITRKLAEELDGIKAISLGHANYGGAMRAGLINSKAPYVVIFDIDYYDIDFLKEALALLKTYDVVIASKLVPEADDRRNPARKLVTRGFGLANKLLFNLKVSDTHGMKAFKRDMIEPIMKDTRLTKDLFDTELIIRAEKAGLNIKEIPVTVEEIRPARTSILRRIPRTVMGLIRLRYILWKERFTQA